MGSNRIFYLISTRLSLALSGREREWKVALLRKIKKGKGFTLPPLVFLTQVKGLSR